MLFGSVCVCMCVGFYYLRFLKFSFAQLLLEHFKSFLLARDPTERRRCFVETPSLRQQFMFATTTTLLTTRRNDGILSFARDTCAGTVAERASALLTEAVVVRICASCGAAEASADGLEHSEVV
jgi:hypothetical protein